MFQAMPSSTADKTAKTVDRKYFETVSYWTRSLSLRVVTAKERSPPTDLLIEAGSGAVDREEAASS